MAGTVYVEVRLELQAPHAGLRPTLAPYEPCGPGQAPMPTLNMEVTGHPNSHPAVL